MKRRKVKIIIFSILAVFVSGFLSFLIALTLLLPIVRKYTVINNTNESFYVTPLMEFGVGFWSLEEELEDADKMKKYIEGVDDFSILSQYLFYSFPLPTFIRKDIKVNPNSKVVIYIEYDNIKQENGPQILLLKDEQDNYFYKGANFWKSDEIVDKTLLQVAPNNLIKSKENSDGTLWNWIVITTLFSLTILFPCLLIREIILLRKEKRVNYKQKL